MLYTKLEQNRRQQMVVGEFGGIQNRPDVPEGWWRDEQNLSSADFPRATVRKARTLCGRIDGIPVSSSIIAACGRDRLVLMDKLGNIWCDQHALPFGTWEWKYEVDSPLQIVDEALVDQMLEGNWGTFRLKFVPWKEETGHYGKWYLIWDTARALDNLADYGLATDWPHSFEEAEPLDIYLSKIPYMSVGKRTLISMGAYVVVMPDKKFVNVEKLAAGDEMVGGVDYGSLERHYLSSCNEAGTASPNVVIVPCTADGTDAPQGYVSGEPPETPQGGDVWVDTSDTDGPVYKRWDAGSSTWIAIPTTYLKIKAEGIGEGFRDLDAVEIKISGTDSEDLREAEGACNGFHELVAVHHDAEQPEDDYIVIVGVMESQELELDCVLKVDRSMPDMDYVVECGNRLWGCHYGKDQSGQILNEIYASRLGDFRNWKDLVMLADSSYAVSRGSDGPYTGAAVLDGHPLFFKESCVEKVFPSSTGAHQVTTVTLDGVEQGSDRSLVVIDNVLYYKSRDSIVRYTGTLPQSVSEPLGHDRFTEAVAGRHGKKYCVGMRNEQTGAYAMYTWDTVRGMWHKEDLEYVQDRVMVTWKDRLYLTDMQNALWAEDGGSDSKGVEWYAETGDIGLELARRKYVSQLQLRIRMETGATARVYVSYDGGPWQRKADLRGGRLQPTIIPITPRRCDRLRLRFEGSGGFELDRIAYQLRTGSAHV